MKKNIVGIVILSLLASVPIVALAKNASSSDSGLTPDSQFYFLKIWKENIQTFFIFNAEQKARQYLHLADVRMAEYEKMLEKGKTELAQKTLDKYEKQLSRAIQKVEELKNKGMDVKNVSEKVATTTAKHIAVLERNLQKVPESAKKGLERALENAKRIRKAEDEIAGLSGKLDEEFELKFGETFSIESEGLKIQFNKVTEDSRCPTNVQCVWAGQVEILLLITKNKLSRGYHALSIGAGSGDSALKVIDEYSVKLIRVEPYPQSGKKIEFSDYVATLVISGDLNSEEVAGWRTYRNEEYKFEVKLPPKKEMLSDKITTSPFYWDSKYEGIYLGELQNGCSFSVYPRIDNNFFSLLKEAEKEMGRPLHPLSKTAQSNQGETYYIGLGIASRAVDVNSCKPFFSQMVSTFKFSE